MPAPTALRSRPATLPLTNSLDGAKKQREVQGISGPVQPSPACPGGAVGRSLTAGLMSRAPRRAEGDPLLHEGPVAAPSPGTGPG